MTNWRESKSHDSSLSNKFIESNVDGEQHQRDGLQESPSGHRWNFDLDGGKASSNTPSQMSVDLYNYFDAEYIGDLYIGYPSQRSTVVIDSGSSWLNVKACMTTSVGCHKHVYENPEKKKEWMAGPPSHLKHYKRRIMKNPSNYHGVSYYSNKTRTAEEVDRIHTFQLAYGSADLTGWKFMDYVCLRKLPDGMDTHEMN